jgi:hypothetical protein
MKNAGGDIVSPSVFVNGTTPTAAPLTKDGSDWVLSQFVFPLGGPTIDILAFGTDSDEATSVADFEDFGVTQWVPVFNTDDAAAGVRFTQDSYTKQMDLLYGSVHGLSAREATGQLSLQHALAQVIFNIRFADKPELAFIETNGTDRKYFVKGIFFVQDIEAYQADPANVPASNITLKTLGTFVIDASRTHIESKWRDLSAQDDKFALPMNPVRRSAGNPDADANIFFSDESSWYRNDIVRDKLYQLGNVLLVPEQPIPSFVLLYNYNGNDYYFTLSFPGEWISGMKYIYNLEIGTVPTT